MLEICVENEAVLRQYRQHVIRCVASEYDRRHIIDNLEEGHALITADYAMKLLPTNAMYYFMKLIIGLYSIFREQQSQWFAKAGVSFHMCAVIAKIGGQLASHSFGHISTISKQVSKEKFYFKKSFNIRIRVLLPESSRNLLPF